MLSISLFSFFPCFSLKATTSAPPSPFHDFCNGKGKIMSPAGPQGTYSLPGFLCSSRKNSRFSFRRFLGFFSRFLFSFCPIAFSPSPDLPTFGHSINTSVRFSLFFPPPHSGHRVYAPGLLVLCLLTKPSAFFLRSTSAPIFPCSNCSPLSFPPGVAPLLPPLPRPPRSRIKSALQDNGDFNSRCNLHLLPSRLVWVPGPPRLS